MPDRSSPSKHPRETSGSDDRVRHSSIILLLILVLTFGAYARTLSFAFVYDDHVQVVTGRTANSDLDWTEILTRDEWAHIAGTSSNFYRPVMPVWRKLNHYWFDTDPFWWHFSSIMLHLVVTSLVYWLALCLLKDRFGAAIAGTVFGLHPIHVESVAWVTGAVDPLVTVWFLACFLCHLSAQATSGLRRYLWLTVALLFFGLSVLTKEIALVMAGLVFAHQWLCGENQTTIWRRFRSAFITSAPYAILTIVYLVIRITVRGSLTGDATPVSLSTMALTWPSLLWFYISHLVWPVGLSEFYDFSYVISTQFKEFVLPVLGVALVAGVLVWWGIRVRVVMFASAWMLLPLLPALNLSVLPYGDFVHDRFLYLPSVGYALLLAIGLRLLPRGQNDSFGQPISQVVAATGLVIALALSTVSEAAHWKTDRDLFTRGITIAPKNKIAINNLATVLLREGELEAAIELYQRILANNPAAWQATQNLGQAYLRQGDLLNAERYFKRALVLEPDHSDTYLYLGFTAMRAGSLDAAETAFRQALSLQPDRPGYYYALGRALKAQDRTQEALTAFQQELRHPSTAKFARKRIEEIRSAE